MGGEAESVRPFFLEPPFTKSAMAPRPVHGHRYRLYGAVAG
jgi:hypothetical protein